MFEIEKKFRFEAGHQLMHHDGKCRDPHGHSYEILIALRSDKLISSGPKVNMVMDFQTISDAAKKMIYDFFDHKWLNTTLNTDSPTAEYIAKWIFEHLQPQLPGLYKVTVYETESSKVVYTQ